MGKGENITFYAFALSLGSPVAIDGHCWAVWFIVSNNSVGVDLPCANALIERRPILDKKGEFDVIGRYNPEDPGAIHIDPSGNEEPVRNADPTNQEARFQGKVANKKMNLIISFVKSSERIGTYTLELGKQGRIIKCM